MEIKIEHANIAEKDSVDDLFSSKDDVTVFIEKPLNFSKIEKEAIFINKGFLLSDDVDAPHVALPKNWINFDNFDDKIYLTMLHNCFVIGGRVKARLNGTYHMNGQLLLTSNKKIINASYNQMDGGKTLPKDLIINHDSEHKKFLINLENNIPIEKGDYYFIGSLHPHFGHFLLEGTSRLWAIDLISERIRKTIKYIIYEDSVHDYVLEYFSLLGIKNNQLLMVGNNIKRFERLIVPDISYRTHLRVSKLFNWDKKILIDALKKNYKSTESPKKIFLSRKYVPDRPLRNREQLENLFQENGYKIVHLEKLTFFEQIKVMLDADDIAGEVGSQMYMSIFSKLKDITRIYIFSPKNFYLQDDFLLSKINENSLNVFLGTSIDYSKKKNEREWEINLLEVKDFIQNK